MKYPLTDYSAASHRLMCAADYYGDAEEVFRYMVTIQAGIRLVVARQAYDHALENVKATA